MILAILKELVQFSVKQFHAVGFFKVVSSNLAQFVIHLCGSN